MQRIRAEKLTTNHKVRNVLKKPLEDDFIPIVSIEKEGEQLYIRTTSFCFYKSPHAEVEIQ